MDRPGDDIAQAEPLRDRRMIRPARALAPLPGRKIFRVRPAELVPARGFFDPVPFAESPAGRAVASGHYAGRIDDLIATTHKLNTSESGPLHWQQLTAFEIVVSELNVKENGLQIAAPAARQLQIVQFAWPVPTQMSDPRALQ
jgi:hypothetical protein